MGDVALAACDRRVRAARHGRGHRLLHGDGASDGKVAFIAQTARIVVIADWAFTATAVIVQPISGALLAQAVGWTFSEGWIVVSLALYVLTGAFWLPVVWMQQRMRNLAKDAAVTGSALPEAYHRIFRAWFICGIPAFAAVLVIIWLMLAKPALTFG